MRSPVNIAGYQPTTSYWLKQWRSRYGDFPSDYLVFDVETTGLDRKHDLIVQLGYCEVRNCRVVHNEGEILNWAEEPCISKSWLERKLTWTKERVSNQGKSYPWSMDVLKSGRKPLDVLADFLVKISNPSKPIIFVAHNGWGFDVPMLENHFKRFLRDNFTFSEHSLIDTGAIEKAIQLGWQPIEAESLRTFAVRVVSEPARVKWSLDGHVIPTYGLVDKHNLDVSKAHTAVFDSFVCHLYLEELRTMLGAACA